MIAEPTPADPHPTDSRRAGMFDLLGEKAVALAVVGALVAGCGASSDGSLSTAPRGGDEPIAVSTAETAPASTSSTLPVGTEPTVAPTMSAPPVALARVPDDVAVLLAEQRFELVAGICDDVNANPPPEPVDFCLFPIDDTTYGPNAYGMALGFNPIGLVLTFERTDDGWGIDQEIDTSLIFAECDVPAPPPGAVVVTNDQGTEINIDIDFNKGTDRVVQWTTADTTYVQAYGEATLRSEPMEVPDGYRVTGSEDIDGQQPTDEVLVLTNDIGETILARVEGCDWVLVQQ